MIKQDIEVVIISDSGRINECGFDCGEGWDSAEVIDVARQRVKARFGEGIRLECINLSKSGVAGFNPELQQKIRAKVLSLPLLIINGEPRISGQFDIRLLLNAIEVEMEIGR